MSKLLDNITSEKYSRKELETLIKNAINKGGYEDIIEACEIELSKLKKKAPSGKKGRASDIVVEKKDGYSIMASAYLENGELRKPELMAVAKIISEHPQAQDVAIMKTQIRLYYKGRHMVSGIKSNETYWYGLLDETKITDSTIERWKTVGTVNTGKYFDTNYVNVQFKDSSDFHAVMDAVSYI